MSFDYKVFKMKRILLFMLPILFFSLFCGCNRGELLDVKKQMEDNVETAKRIEEMRKQLMIDFENAKVFYEAMEKKLYVTGVNNFVDGTYVVHYSDGSELRLYNGTTSFVTFGEDGEVIINGKPTGCKPVDGESSGRTPVITIDEDGYYIVDGVKTILLKGEDGKDGYTPVVSIDAGGFYCLDGVRIVPEINLRGIDGKPGTAPVPSIKWNEEVGKHELCIDGNPTVPPTYVSPEDGVDGAPSVSPGRFIKQITLSSKNELIFTFSDGTVEKSSPVKLTDLAFEMKETDVKDIAIGESRRINYAVYTDYTTNPVSVNQMYSLRGWQVLITAPDPVTKEGYITVTPVSGLASSGVLMLMTIDAQQRTVTQKVALSVRPYQINLPASFNESYIYDVRTETGTKIAMISKEYLKGSGKMFVVVYPCNDDGTEYGEGFVTDNGGYVNYAGDFYKNGSKSPLRTVLLNSGSIGVITGSPAATVVGAVTAMDIDGNKYKTVKIGAHQWMAENLKTTHFSSGQRILTQAEVAGENLGAYAYYNNDASLKNTYGALYNGGAVVKNGRLAPVGWHVARRDEWESLTLFLAGTSPYNAGRLLKSEKIGLNSAAGEWVAGSDPGNNLSGFTAYPGGYLLGGVFTGIASEAKWWMSGSGVFTLSSSSLSSYESFTGAASSKVNGYYSVRCVKDEKK